MLSKKISTIFGTTVLFILLSFNSSYADIINGDFSSGLNGWTNEDIDKNWNITDLSANVVVTDGGYAKLETQGILSDVHGISINQALTIPDWAYTLSFDIGFQKSNTDSIQNPEGNASFPDFMEVSYWYDNDSFVEYFIGIDFFSLYDPNTWDTLSLESDDLYDITWYHFSADITALRGESGTLYFDLWDGDDGFISQAYVDNVSINPIPEPSTLMLLCAGLAGLGMFSRRKKL